jgi:hypothetical protein
VSTHTIFYFCLFLFFCHSHGAHGHIRVGGDIAAVGRASKAPAHAQATPRDARKRRRAVR